MRVTDLCVSVCLCPQCLWPLGDIDDLDAVCLPVSDPRVRRWRQSALSGSLHADAQMTGNDGNGGATAMSASSLQLGGLSHSANSPSAAAALPTVARDPSAESDPDLELQRISNMLLQPSPACSPALAATAWPLRLPTGDSLPPSASLGPTGGTNPVPADIWAAFELPPAAAVNPAAGILSNDFVAERTHDVED